nr:hypothetical protein [Pseudomonas corrugata]
MAEYILPSGREVVSEVLLKLDPSALAKLPVACKTCLDAVWQITGKSTDKVQVRCFCPVLHSFTWSAQQTEEILDCEHLYKTEEEEVEETDPAELPPFLREQQTSQAQPVQMEIDG